MMPFIFSLSETLYRNDQSIHFSYCLHSGLDVCITFKSVILTNLFCYFSFLEFKHMCDRIRLELDSGLAKEKSVSSLWTYFMES